MDPLLEKLAIALHAKDWHSMYEAKKSLAGDISAETLGAMLQALQADDRLVRMHVAEVLGERRERSALPHLIAALEKDEDWSVRQSMVRSLGELRTPDAIEGLIGALKDRNIYPRREAVTALQELADPRAVEPLLSALADEDAGVRSSAAAFFLRVPDSRAFQALVSCLKDSDETVRIAAIRSLGAAHDPRALAPLVETVQGDSGNVAWAAAGAVMALKQPNGFQAIVARFGHAKYNMFEVVRALAEINRPDAAAPLLLLTKNQDAEVRDRARKALEQLQLSEAEKAALGPAEKLNRVKLVLFLRAEVPPQDTQGYLRHALSQRYDPSCVVLEEHRIVGVKEELGLAYARDDYERLRRSGDLPDFGQIVDSFAGKAPDGRSFVAFFFEKPGS